MTSEPIPYLSVGNKNGAQHEHTEHLAIQNTFIRRCLSLLALKTTSRLYAPRGFCVPISKKKIIKTGPYVHLIEAATMKFVAENTSIPVPKVHCSFVHKNRVYIVMERIQGDELPTAWRKLSEHSRQIVFEQLKHMLQDLRSIEHSSGTRVESCTGGSLRDSRIPRSSPRFGPFETIQNFHLWLRQDLQPSGVEGKENDQDWQEIKEMAVKQDGPWPAPAFTHADLTPFNILIREGQVVGIIDWELSGWYPDYWEYTSAFLSSVTRTEWQGSVCRFLDPFPQELKMEATRQRWWGEI